MTDTVREIALPTGETAVVDAADWPLVCGYRWYAFSGPWTTYARARIGTQDSGRRRYAYLHRLLLGAGVGEQVDHIDHDGLNNRRANLRIATCSQNAGNSRRRSDNKSGYKGVSWYARSGKWWACIRRDGKTRHLGYFSDPWDAAMAYNVAAREVFGEFAYVNVRQTTPERAA